MYFQIKKKMKYITGYWASLMFVFYLKLANKGKDKKNIFGENVFIFFYKQNKLTKNT